MCQSTRPRSTESLAAVLIVGLLWTLGKQLTPPAGFGSYLALSGVSRFLVELLRLNDPGLLGLTQPQLWALASFAAGLVLVARNVRPGIPRAVTLEVPRTDEPMTVRSPG